MQKQRIEKFKFLCRYGQHNDIQAIQTLIQEGLDINSISDFDSLAVCIKNNRSLPFIRILVESGLLVTNKHIEYCYANIKKNKNYPSIISILEKAKNIDNDAAKNILKRKRTNVIGSISVSCICLFSLILPQILNREMEGGYYVFIGIITTFFLLLVLLSIVELRKKR